MVAEDYIRQFKQALNKLDIEEIEEIVKLIDNKIKQNKNIFLCGNGGSAANSSHSAGDWSKEIKAKTLCLTDNIAAVTAWANDTDFSNIFSSQLEIYYNEGDILLAFSGSGNSPNVIKAVEYVSNLGGITIGFTGNYNGGQGGKLAQLATHSIGFETTSMEIIEDLQLVVCHIIKESIKSNNR